MRRTQELLRRPFGLLGKQVPSRSEGKRIQGSCKLLLPELNRHYQPYEQPTGITLRVIVKVKERLGDPLYRNSFYVMLNSAVAAPLGYVFWIIVARFYSPQEVGVASALMAASMLLVAFSRLGFDIGVVRFLPGETNKQVMINSCLTVVSLVSLASSFIFIAGLDFWSPALSFVRGDSPFLISFIGFTTASALLSMQTCVFIALRRPEFSLIQNLISTVPRVTLPVLMVAAGAFGLFFSWGIGVCLAVVLSVFIFIPRVQSGYRPVPALAKRVLNDMMRFSFMNYICLALETSTIMILPLLIINILNPEATAYFRLAWAVSSALFYTIPSAVAISLFVEGSHDPPKLRQNVTKAAKLTLALLIPGTAIMFLFGEKILLLFGSQYSENALSLMLVLTVSWIPFTVNELYIVIKMVQMKMNTVIIIRGFIAALTIGISYALMPRMGIIAVAVGWSLSQTIVAATIGSMLVGKRGFWGKRPVLSSDS